MAGSERPFEMLHFDDVPGVACPCGMARRAFADLADYPATIHRTEIREDARPHYHRRLTETYYVLQCEDGAQIELDGQRHPVRPGTCVLIRPGTVHRAVGKMSVLIVVIPKFDPEDEVLVD